MKNLKKVISILLVVCMAAGLVVMLNSCGKVTDENPGAVIEVYAPYTVSLDPAVAYADEASSKLLSLLYEGLTVIDSKGKVKGALAESWTTSIDRDGNKVLEIKLKTTRWSDGLTVDSEDFVDSWERILDPSFNCQAASLLFPIKNAAAVKRGDMTVSDLGISAAKQDTLTVILEDWADPETFMYNCASVALYPIRKDVINKIYDKDTGKENDWSTLVAIMQSNGPFFLKRVSFGTTESGSGDDNENSTTVTVSTRPYITLERNKNYYLDPEKNQSLDKYVVPYQINVNMTYGNDDVNTFIAPMVTQVKNAYRQQHGSDMVADTVEAIRATMTEEELESYGSDLEAALTAMAEEQILEQVKADYSIDYAESMLEKIRDNKLLFSTIDEPGAEGNNRALYNSSLPLTEEITGVKTVNSLMTGAFYFNTANTLFQNAKVRNALSLALDREEIASLVKYAEAADTLVTSGVFNTTRKTSFKDNAKDYAISTTADLDAAKSLLREAGVSGGSFSISIRATETDILIAQYAAEVWKELGFDVSLKIYGYNLTTYTERMLVTTDQIGEDGKPIKEWQNVVIYDGLLHDSFVDAYNSCDFDVMFYDVNMLTTDAFPVLAQFATVFSGRAYDFSDSANFDITLPHVTGYSNSAYDALMEQAMTETDAARRAELLHEAEALLLTDMPITPVIYYQNAYKVSDELDDLEFSYFGAPIFRDVSYDNYVAVEETDAADTTAAETE